MNFIVLFTEKNHHGKRPFNGPNVNDDNETPFTTITLLDKFDYY